MAKLVVENVTKKYGPALTLEKISFTAEEGQITVLLSPPNGGKTGICKIVAGLDEVDSGKVYLGDRDITDLEPKERRVSMMFQKLALYPNMNVFENIASPLKALHLPPSEVINQVEAIANKMKISHTLYRKPGTLSGGERQRVALSRALVKNNADLYILDEPLTNLDAKIRASMRAEFKILQKEINQTMLYATPDPIEALALADKLIVLDKGKIIQQGTPEYIYRNPINKFVATFVGYYPINLIEGSIIEKGEKIILQTNLFEIEISKLRDSVKDHINSKVTLGLRPELLNVVKKEPKVQESLDLFYIKGEVFEFEIRGSDTVVYVKINDQIIRVLESKITKYDIGIKVWLQFNLKDIYLFDAESGLLIR
ncbi:MAG: ABC transporter ATP-binding protein [Nitrososphaeria archaeon]